MLKETGEDAYCRDISVGKVCFERGKEERKYINDSLPKKKPDEVGKYVYTRPLEWIKFHFQLERISLVLFF